MSGAIRRSRSRDLPTLFQNPRLRARHEQCRKALAEFQERREVDAFWSRVDQSGGETTCWLWLGTICGEGYGVYRLHGEYLAHRVAYALSRGSAAKRWRVRHKAGCPRHCVNPAHLKRGTQRRNMQDKVNDGRARGGPKFGQGELNNRAKFCRAQVLIAWEMRAEGYFIAEIALITGITYRSLENIFRGATWACLAPKTV